MNEKLVTIIVGVYKVEEYLDKCINSIVGQTYENLELILVDDGSPDKCPAICDQWALRDGRIKVIHKPNGGISSARNAGLEVASGEYIMYVDSDDYIDQKMVETLVKEMQNPRVDIVECGFRLVQDNTLQDSAVQGDILTPEVAICNILLWSGKIKNVVWNKMYRHSVIKDIRFQNEQRYGEETHYLYEVIKRTDLYVQIPYMGYYYLKRDTSLVGNSFKSYMLQSLTSAKQMVDKIEKDYPQFLEQVHCNVVLDAYLLACTLLSTPNGVQRFSKEYEEIREVLRNSDPSICRKYLSTQQFIKLELCRLVPGVFRVIYCIWQKTKKHQ